MKILIISPGKGHDRTVADGIQEYEKRLGKRLTIEWAFPAVGTKELEGIAIIKLVKNSDYLVLLDERGKDSSTPEFANFLNQQLQSGIKRLVFVIGGAFGVDNSVKFRAHMILRISSLVFPHMLVRLVLIEQLYRAVSIIDGGKYHHG